MPTIAAFDVTISPEDSAKLGRIERVRLVLSICTEDLSRTLGVTIDFDASDRQAYHKTNATKAIERHFADQIKRP